MQIGRYEVLEELGRGGAGAVYKARDPSSGREVAIKVLLDGRHANEYQRTRFDREARALAKVQHRSVVRLLEVGAQQGAPYLVTDYQPAGSLEAALKTSVLTPQECARCGTELAAGLEAAHALGVLHRDVKPANVLITPSGLPLLTDFGLAKDLEREGQTQALTKSGTLQGTPGYWAPEQAEGKLDLVGPATDVYGLGATLYAALTGRAPIVGESFLLVLTATSLERPPAIRSLRPEVPRDLEAVILRCLEKEASARWSSATELRQALEGCLQAANSEASPKTPSKRRAAGLAVSLAAIGLAAIGLAAIGLAPPAAQEVSQGESPPPAPPEALSPQALYARAREEQKAGRLESAAALARTAAEQGHAPAMTWFGVALAKGLGVRADKALAAQWHRRAAEGGDRVGMYNYGFALKDGAGVLQAESLALQWFRRAAEGKGALPEAMFNVALMLQRGMGAARDEAEAAKWYQRAADQGHLGSMVNLGILLTRQDKVAEAVEWFRLAAAQGSAHGMLNLAEQLTLGPREILDPVEAKEWYERVLREGGPALQQPAQVGLSRIRALGELHKRGVRALKAKERKQAARLFRRAAEKGHPGSMCSLGVMLRAGAGVAKDQAQARTWFRHAAERGHPGSMLNLGHMLANGKGGAADEAQSAEWYRQAAEEGHARAMYELARALHQGRGVEKDAAKAELWIERAAEEGNDQAMYRLATLVLGRKGSPADRRRGVRWLQYAAQAADPNVRKTASAMLERHRLPGAGTELVPQTPLVLEAYAEIEAGRAQAGLALLRRGATEGQPEAMVALASYLAKDQRVETSEVEAWYRRAAEAGHPNAALNLGILLLKRRDQEGLEWYRRAAKEGNVTAMFLLGKTLAGGAPTERTVAAGWYRKAAEAGHARSMLNLGALLVSEEFAEKDEAQALKWLQRAAKSTDPPARSQAKALLAELGAR